MNDKLEKIKQLESWFLTTYLLRLMSIKRCKYLGIESDDNEYELQLEAYRKEQEYRKLMGKKELPQLQELFNLN